ncbi:phosphodiesterase, MJ0936 family [Desulfobulbus propionicus DSM 2032]|jgi:putative phosphoesterase|uniref:Phosphoesterase n=1 Tax=Desulfobulbus propionicus (strain ATCC 33891 / DSM 2032 / VKM B-1956 / 1pr3) TaxID=577650 RepID=A0A7U3YNS8_DESPD|nr:metallophosphoesterase family protein [Desulfobulbus propionicus]ADW18783.1 phosphodiesterase, MJ0936 family [Desulfobulbus propionicus DSM 2032]
MVIRAGVLSDTHLIRPDSRFKTQVAACFATCDMIIHAGDLTDLSVLEVFAGRPVYAVHGNMCHASVRDRYPHQLQFSIGSFVIGLTHGAGLGYDIEAALWDLFPEVDCMIYGHTHRPLCRRVGRILLLNPGSFQATGRYGAPGSYAILEAGDTLQARLFDVPQL